MDPTLSFVYFRSVCLARSIHILHSIELYSTKRQKKLISMVPSSVSCDYRCKQQQKREKIHSILFSVPGTNLHELHSYYSEGEWITLFRTRSWANGKSVSGNETALFETHKTSNMQIGNWAEQMLFIQIKCSSCQLFGNTKTGQWKQPTHFSRVWIRIPIRLG